MRNYNNNFTWFVVVGEGLDKVNRGGAISFKEYTDHANAHGKGTGALVRYITSRDQNGRDAGKYFVIDDSRRRFQVRDGENDIYGISQYDFLRFYPDCEGSPNGQYSEVGGVQVQQGIVFRELNTDKDAEVALEAESTRTRAQASVLGLDEATLQELGAFIGEFGEPGKTMRLRVFEWAGKRPSEYFKILESGDRGLRAIIRKAIEDGTFRKKGSIIYWEDTVIGADEDAAAATLMRDSKMLDALQRKVDLKTEIKAKTGRGRPAGSKNKTPNDSPGKTAESEKQL